MNRREFVKISSSLTLSSLLASCREENINEKRYDITFSSDMDAGHLIFKSDHWETNYISKKEFIIVGGGVAGLAAANKIKDKDFLLFELGEKTGGSSSSQSYKGTPFSEGAHYDWSYPSTYGSEVLELLKELKIIHFNPKTNFWNFKDTKYIIKGTETQSYVSGKYYADYLEDFKEFSQFLAIINPFLGSMLLPTRIISSNLKYLNTLTFQQFLENKGLIASKKFLETLSYLLRDDYGAGVEIISALAGIHYFMCRPYYTQKIELFSPPQGNSYFIEKLQEGISAKIKTRHVVKKITSTNDSFLVDVINIENQRIDQYSCNKIVYAGQKHALKFILPEQYNLFSQTKYSPWAVMNIILNEPIDIEPVWQNEFPLNTDNFMGFVNSSSQFQHRKNVLTCYFCFQPEERNQLPKIKNNLHNFTQNTINTLNTYFDRDLNPLIEKIFIKVMGHAMPIPTVDYLFNEANDKRYYKNITFAGVDNGRLPLLFEAVDSGIMAVKHLERK